MLKKGPNESSLFWFGLCIPVLRKNNIWLADVIEHVDTLHESVGAAVEHLEEDNAQAVYVDFLDEKKVERGSAKYFANKGCRRMDPR